MNGTVSNIFRQPVVNHITKDEYLKALAITLTYECENRIERWQVIPGLNGKYLASNLGDIKSIVFRKPKILKPMLKGNHYYLNVINAENKREQIRADFLIANAFLKNEGNKKKVLHKDGNNSNRILINLSFK